MIDLDDYMVMQEDSKSSRKYYKMTCDECKSDRGYQRKSRHGSGLCKSCASRLTHSGKIVSEKTKARMKSSHYLKNGGKHPLTGKFHSHATKVKLSVAAAKQNSNYVSKHLYSGPSGPIYMKSSWEVRYACWLDLNSKKWLYEPKFKLSNGFVYLPDFQLSTGDIIEIKGYMRPDAQVKWDMFCKEYPNINKSLVRKSDMKLIGLI